jgi:signal peptidase
MGLVVLGAGLVLLTGLRARTNRATVTVDATHPVTPSDAPASDEVGTLTQAASPRRGIVGRLTQLVAGLVVVAACATFALIGLGPLTGRYRVITVLSGSMSPKMPAGSLVISVPEPLSALRVGQVVTFEAPTAAHQVVTHRVIQITTTPAGPKIRTKGDANTSPDAWVAQLRGGPIWREVKAIPNGGRLVYWFRQPAVHRLAVDAIPLILALGVLSAIWRSGRTARSTASPALA